MNPQSVNPPAGYVYSANNAPDSVKGVYHSGHYYSGNTRGAGIIEAIEAKDDRHCRSSRPCNSTTIRPSTGRTAR